MQPLVSIVIPTRNSALTLKLCLESVKKQTYSNIETIVVDNNSRDSTLRIAGDYGAIVLTKGPERSAQMNFGIRKSGGKYVYRLDSDMIASPGVVDEAVEICESASIDGVIIRVISDPTVSFWSKVRSFERMNLYHYDSNVAVRFLSRRAFDKVNGFDESLNGFEDYDLHDRFVGAGFHFGRINSNEVHIGEPRTLSEIAVKHFYYGKDLRRYVTKNGKAVSNTRRLNLVRRGQAINDMMKQPKILAGFFIYQTVRYFSTALGMVLGS